MRVSYKAIGGALCAIAAGCIGPGPTTFDEDAPVAFGDLRVLTVTTGTPDASGYRVRLDESLSSLVSPNGEVTFTGLATKAYEVVLEETGSCVPQAPNPRSITIVSGTTLETAFTVDCP